MNFFRKCKIPFWVFGLLAGFLFLGIGFAEEQYAFIFKKAAMICLECIGIG